MNSKSFFKALVFFLLMMPHQLYARKCKRDELSREDESSGYVKLLYMGGGAAAFVASVPVVLSAAGFTSRGIERNSLASYMMSIAAAANGGGIASTSIVASLQSTRMAGLGTIGNGLLSLVGAKVGGNFYESHKKDNKKASQDC